MITVLTVKSNTAEDRRKKIKNFFIRDTIKTEIITLQKLTIVHIIYYDMHGKIKWKKIGEQLGYEKKNVFCDSSIKLPRELGFRRYNYHTHMCKMAENAAIAVLKESTVAPNKISVGLYDPDASHADIAQKLVEYTANLTVITSECDIYHKLQENILEETGASIVVQKLTDKMQNFNILIAPKQINRYIHLPYKTLVFTGEYPTVPVHGIVYSSYRFCLPGWCRRIKPNSLSDQYFAQALYDKAHQYMLGSIVPYSCLSDNGEATIKEVSHILKTACENT